MSIPPVLPRVGRYLAFILLCPRFLLPGRWHWLRYYPPVVPDELLLSRWSGSEWPDYQRWIDRNDRMDLRRWRRLHQRARSRPPAASISIVTPVFNTPPAILQECILSVRMQTSPYWEWILVDDASASPETRAVLASPFVRDPRIRIFSTGGGRPAGISAATNLGIARARGEFVVFLDHDDRLALETVQVLEETLAADPDLDIVYSDRDMLSPQGRRYMHLMKPDWSPETLLSGNYVFHLLCYRKSLIGRVGGLRGEYDGSQDYDLILRCMEHTDRIAHVRRVLYHWRQHPASVSLDDGAKSFAFDAGVRALRDALRRRGIDGRVEEEGNLWRGHYRVRLPFPPPAAADRILLPPESGGQGYAAQVRAARCTGRPYLLIRDGEVTPADTGAEPELLSWLRLEKVGLVTGRTLDARGRNVYAGAVLTRRGTLLRPYHGFPAAEPGYMAVTSIVRNLSVPDPFCLAVRRELWERLGGLDPAFQSPWAMLDFALRALASGWRIVYVPSARFECREDPWVGRFPERDRAVFASRWRAWVRRGDPAYNPNLSESSDRYELALETSTQGDRPKTLDEG